MIYRVRFDRRLDATQSQVLSVEVDDDAVRTSDVHTAAWAEFKRRLPDEEREQWYIMAYWSRAAVEQSAASLLFEQDA